MADKCRVCRNDFFKEPLLKYKNMPSVAQHLPDAESLKDDKGVELEICQCSGCYLVQLNNEPVPYYREVIRASAVSEEMKNFRIEQFKDFVKKYSLENKKIVEIGCGRGEYLEILQKCSVDAYGLEQAIESVMQCQAKGLKVERRFLEKKTDKISNAPFDAFFMLSFLEHLPDPNSTLHGILNNLTENAVGIVEVPNFDMILQKNLFSEFMRDHLSYFTKKTLETTLTLNGFEVIESEPVWHEYLISAVVKKIKRLDLSRFYARQEKLKQDINEYISRFGRDVAVWGAGHQALAVIAMTDIADKIKYVVDSAQFKQGKYTPATHILIVAPETLNSDPVKAIIVMAASYSDEVAEIIRQKYDKKIDIAILRDFGLERK